MPHVKFKQPIFRKKLFISKKPYYFEKSESEGLKELESLSCSAWNEGVWLFSHDKSAWFNVTTDHKRSPAWKDYVDFSASSNFTDIGQFGKKITHCHIHPARAYGILEHTLRETYQEKALLFQDIIEESPEVKIALKFLNRTFHLPSSADLTTYKNLKMQNQDVDFYARIIAPTGHSLIKIVDPKEGESFDSWGRRAERAVADYTKEETNLTPQRYIENALYGALNNPEKARKDFQLYRDKKISLKDWINRTKELTSVDFIPGLKDLIYSVKSVFEISTLP